jgi:hypothetical protein
MTGFSPRFMAATLPTMPHRDPGKACRAILESFPEAPCCSTATLSPGEAEKVFPYTHNLSRRLREKYFGAAQGR